MGKSVFFGPSKEKDAQIKQMRKLRDKFGLDSLKLDGPFLDKSGAAAKIAAQVQSWTEDSPRDNVIQTAVRTLLPQNKLPGNLPSDCRSRLEIPFIAGTAPGGWQKRYPEIAGETASAGAVEYNGGLARPAGAVALTTLAMSVLRMLGVECYFSQCTCIPNIPEEALPAGTEATIVLHVLPLRTAPIIIVPDGPRPRQLSLIPDYGFFSNVTNLSFEVLDSDALMALIKLHNARRHAMALMTDLMNYLPGSDEERTSRAVRIGHMVHEGVSLWKLSDAEEDLGSARKLFGPYEHQLNSARYDLEDDIVHAITCLERHAEVAALVMRTEDFHGPPFTDYMDLARLMNEHLHEASECNADSGGEKKN